MKNTYFSTLLCSFVAIMFLGCEKSAIQKNTIPDDAISIIEIRSSCEECPGEDECCCAVWLDNEMSGYAKISLCGTSDGLTGCSGDAIGNCPAPSGGFHSFELVGPDTGRKRFCMNEGDAFWIANTHSTLSMDIWLTCQDDITNGQNLHIVIPAGQRWYYEVNNACELSLCD